MERQLNFLIEGRHGRPIVADMIYRKDAERKPILIFAHGFKGYKDWGTFPLVAETFAKAGFVVLKFNFSHNGGTAENPIDFPDLEAFSENNFTKEQDDLDAVISWLGGGQLPLQETNLNKIYLVGHSRGGAAAIIRAAHDHRIKKLVSWAAVADLEERMKAYPISEWREKGVVTVRNGRTKQDMPLKYQLYEDLVRNREHLNVELAAHQIKIPWLIIHGDDDQAVPIADAAKLKHWCDHAHYLVVEKAGHTFGGAHPWESDTLPDDLSVVVRATIRFLLSESR